MEKHSCQIQNHFTICRINRKRLPKTFDRQQCVSFDAMKIANLIVKLNTSRFVALRLPQFHFQRVNVEALPHFSALGFGCECEQDIWLGRRFVLLTIGYPDQIVENCKINNLTAIKNFILMLLRWVVFRLFCAIFESVVNWSFVITTAQRSEQEEAWKKIIYYFAYLWMFFLYYFFESIFFFAGCMYWSYLITFLKKNIKKICCNFVSI